MPHKPVRRPLGLRALVLTQLAALGVFILLAIALLGVLVASVKILKTIY